MATSEPCAQDFGFADLEGLRVFFDWSAGADAARIADGDGAVVLERGEQHVLQLVLVLGVHVDDVGDAAQIADVEEAVVGGAVVAGEAAAVHAEDDGEILQRNVVHDLVEGALEEGGVDGAEGAEALGGHARGEEHGVLLGDADVEVALGVVRAEEVERGAVGHGGGDGDDSCRPCRRAW